MPVVTDIADAVVDALNGYSFSETFTAVRSFRPRYDLTELATLLVTVVPKSRTQEQLTRTSNREDIEIDVGIQKQVSTDDGAVEDLMELADEIVDFMDRNEVGGAKWMGMTNDPIYDPTYLTEKNVFFTVLTFKMMLVRTP